MIRAAIRTSRVLAAVLLACVGFVASAADLKIATVAPDGSHWMQQMRAGAEEIKTRTAGRVTVKFYPGGVMGNDSQVLRKIRANQLQGGAFASGGLADRYNGAEPLRHPAAVPLARQRSTRSEREIDPKLDRGPRAGRLRELWLHRGRLREPVLERADSQRSARCAARRSGSPTAIRSASLRCKSSDCRR